jgi:hypothetical protein
MLSRRNVLGLVKELEMLHREAWMTSLAAKAKLSHEQFPKIMSTAINHRNSSNIFETLANLFTRNPASTSKHCTQKSTPRL